MSVPLLLLTATIATGSIAQQPTPAPTLSSGMPADRSKPVAPKASVEGCIATGKEAGRKADLREKTGLDEHFVIVGAKVVKGRGPAAAAPAPGSPAGAMFKINGLTDEQMKIHVGRRVRIEGSFGSLEQPAASPDGAPQDNLVELNVATIRQIPGDCSVPKS